MLDINRFLVGAWVTAVDALTNPAANPIITEDFEGFSPGSQPQTFITPTEITFINNTNGIIDNFPGFSGQVLDIFTLPGGIETSTVEFPSSVAFGLDISDNVASSISGPIDYILSSGQTGQIDLTNSGVEFLGFVQEVNDPLLTSIQFTPQSNDSAGFGNLAFDDVSYATPSTQTPEPSAILSLLAVGSIGALVRRKKA